MHWRTPRKRTRRDPLRPLPSSRLRSAAPRGPKMADAPPAPAAPALHAALTPSARPGSPGLCSTPRPDPRPHRLEPPAPHRAAPHHDGSADPACSRLPRRCPTGKGRSRRGAAATSAAVSLRAPPRPAPLAPRRPHASPRQPPHPAPALRCSAFPSSIPPSPPRGAAATPRSEGLFSGGGIRRDGRSVTKIKFLREFLFIYLLLFF